MCVARALAELPPLLTLEALTRWRDASLRGLHEMSDSYTNHHLHVLRTVVRRAEMATQDHELVRLIWRVGLIRVVGRTPRALPRDLLRCALGVAVSPAERAWLLLAGLGGLRYGELLGLRPEDYDTDAGVLRVVRQRRRPNRKNYRPHLVRVDCPELRRCLAWTIECHDALAARDARRRDKSAPHLFPWSTRYAERFLARLRARLGTKYLPQGIAWHAFRVWGATELARDGAGVFDIQEWLGDANPTVATGYVSFVRGTTSSSVSRLARLSKKSPRSGVGAPDRGSTGSTKGQKPGVSDEFQESDPRR